jgi:hypothetical protein
VIAFLQLTRGAVHSPATWPVGTFSRFQVLTAAMCGLLRLGKVRGTRQGGAVLVGLPGRAGVHAVRRGDGGIWGNTPVVAVAERGRGDGHPVYRPVSSSLISSRQGR